MYCNASQNSKWLLRVRHTRFTLQSLEVNELLIPNVVGNTDGQKLIFEMQQFFEFWNLSIQHTTVGDGENPMAWKRYFVVCCAFLNFRTILPINAVLTPKVPN
jgi:hypothetical protein